MLKWNMMLNYAMSQAPNEQKIKVDIFYVVHIYDAYMKKKKKRNRKIKIKKTYLKCPIFFST